MKKYLLILISACCLQASYAQVADSAKRHVVLQGAANFRDLGGYETKDGHHVKWGEIYRSADMSKLTDDDLKALKGNSGDSLMVIFYGKTDSLAARYKPFFDKLLGLPSGNSLVFHCTAGKDRTGIGAALLLYALGVPYNTIVNDYLASNYYRADANKKMVGQMVTYAHIDEQVAKDMAGVKKEYLDATFDTIVKQYGSVDNFLKNQIGLNNKKIAILKKKFLE